MSNLPEWAFVSLGEIATSQYGMSLSASADGNVPIIGMQHVKDGRLDLRDLSLVVVTPEDLDKYAVRDGDLLFNRTNSAAQVGKTAIVTDVGDAPMVFASYLVRLTVDRTRAIPAFVNHVLTSTASVDRLRALATPGVSQYNINPTSLLKRFTLCLPSMAEQTTIVDTLARLGRRTVATDQLIDAKRRYKRGLMQRLLTGELRLSISDSAIPRRRTRFGSIPGDWGYPRMADVGAEVVERADASDMSEVLSCSKYDGLVDSMSYFGKQVFSDDRSNYKVVRRGEFAFPANHVEEGSIGLLLHRDRGLVSPIYVVFSVDETLVPEFLYSVLKTETYKHIFATSTNASVNRRGSLRWADFSEIRVPQPPLGEQQKIVDLVRALDREIELLELQRDLFEKQRRAVTEKLLSGEVRVPVTATTVAD